MPSERVGGVTAGPCVLVLGSGRGERFRASGGTVHKLDAPLHGKRLLEHVIAAVEESGLSWHLERSSHPGMGDTIAAAVRASAHADGWLVLPADLPLVRAETLRHVAHAVNTHAAVVPRWRGQRGHPVGFSKACKEALLALSGDGGANSVVRMHAAHGRVAWLDVEDQGCVLDVDTVEDLLALERRVAMEK
jgi:molybdenum cofactor cytidylyltransferase